MVTESDELRAALDAAAIRWPGTSRSELLARLALAGAGAVHRSDAERAEHRRAALHALVGAFSGCYGPGYLDGLRSEWPE